MCGEGGGGCMVPYVIHRLKQHIATHINAHKNIAFKVDMIKCSFHGGFIVNTIEI